MADSVSKTWLRIRIPPTARAFVWPARKTCRSHCTGTVWADFSDFPQSNFKSV